VGARAATWLAYSMCALSLALTALSLVLLRSNLSHPGLPVYEFWVPNTLVALGFSPVGAFVASHLPPKNPMGWLLCTINLFMGVAHLSGESAIHALPATHHTLGTGEAAAWMMSWFWILPVGLSVFLFLLFPDGRLPGRR
jgi:two-component system NarL family sensor kinase